MPGVYRREAGPDNAAVQHVVDLTRSFAEETGRRPKILVAKVGQDGHDRGQKVIASAFADLGFDVALGPLFATPAEAAAQAAGENVHILGISSLAAGHLTLIPEIRSELNRLGRSDIMLVVGGVIPAKDFDVISAAGVQRDLPAWNRDHRCGGAPDDGPECGSGLRSEGAGRLPGGARGLATMIGRLNHVAIVVPDLAAASAQYRDMLGATVSEPRNLPEHGVTVVFVALPNSKIELMTPLGHTSPIQAFLNRNPSGGMHHVCFEVEDLLAARDALLGKGARVLGDGEPRVGAHGLPVLFLHPKDFGGTLIELEDVGRLNSPTPQGA